MMPTATMCMCRRCLVCLYSQLLYAVPDLDKEALGYSTPNSPPSPPEEDGTVNKGGDDEGFLKSCNMLKWSATV